MFLMHNEKEMLLSNKRKLPTGVYTNEEFLLHVKYNRDMLHLIYHLAKSLPQYREKSRLDGDCLVINRTRYRVEDIHNLPADLVAYKAAEKSNDTHLVFAGELILYSNFHKSMFIINSQKFHSSEQWVQYQKALTFGDSFIANKILNSETPLKYKHLSYHINGLDQDKWQNEGYEVCFDRI